MKKLLPLKSFFIIVGFLFLHNTSYSQDSDTVQSEIIDTVIVDSVKIDDNYSKLKIGDLSDGNKSVPVHLIKMYDYNGYSIHKDDNYDVPFSTKNTCGDCHSYNRIKEGTHFAIDSKDYTIRAGEPYIYHNYKALTLLPLSYRDWEGTYSPDSVGITAFEFTKMFGSHLAGGNITENEDLESPENFFRWQVSGKLEINCLVCHDSDPQYDQAEFAKQIKNENYKWAAPGASSLATAEGYASKMPDNFDAYNSNTFADVDLRTTPPPSIKYKDGIFDKNNKVFFNIDKRVKNERCLFCHTTALNTENVDIVSNEDIHLASGLACTNCHKNDIDHRISAGYDQNADKPDALSCKGCHIQSDNNKYAGLYGAPIPEHKGFPKIHFEKLSCTVCHSSFMLDENALFTKTSRAHKLGVPGPNKMPLTFPLLQSPVLVKNQFGVIEPRILTWPSYWAFENNNEIKPYNIDFVNKNIQPFLNIDSTFNFGNWPTISDSLLIFVLDTLKSFPNNPVFISGGNLYKLNDQKDLISEKHTKAEPYSWPIAHDVRPALQSIGSSGCDDCHSVNSRFFNSDVKIISSLSKESNKYLSMINFEGLNSIYQTVFSFSFYFKPLLRVVIILSALIILLVFLSYIFGGFRTLTEYISAEPNNEKEDVD